MYTVFQGKNLMKIQKRKPKSVYGTSKKKWKIIYLKIEKNLTLKYQ